VKLIPDGIKQSIVDQTVALITGLDEIHRVGETLDKALSRISWVAALADWRGDIRSAVLSLLPAKDASNALESMWMIMKYVQVRRDFMNAGDDVEEASRGQLFFWDALLFEEFNPNVNMTSFKEALYNTLHRHRWADWDLMAGHTDRATEWIEKWPDNVAEFGVNFRRVGYLFRRDRAAQEEAFQDARLDGAYPAVDYMHLQTLAQFFEDRVAAPSLPNEVLVSLDRFRIALHDRLTEVAKWLYEQSEDLLKTAKALRDELKADVLQVAKALHDGVTSDLDKIAKALWRNVTDDLQLLARALWEIAERDFGKLGAVLADLQISYTSIADVLWNGIGGLTPRALGQILWNEGASGTELGFALRDGARFSLSTIADVLADLGISFTHIADVLWNKLGGLTDRDLGQILKNELANSAQIGVALRDGAGFSLARIGDVLGDLGETYKTIADVLWNKLGGLTARNLGQILKNELASPAQIGEALRDSAGFTLPAIGDILADIGENYRTIADVLWNKLGGLSPRDLGQILKNELASPAEIGEALRDGAGFLLPAIGDVLNDLGLSYPEIADVLWKCLGGLSPRELGQILENELASPNQIGLALRVGAGFSHRTIADVLNGQLALSYRTIGDVLWDLGGLSPRELAKIILDEGAGRDTAVDVLVSVVGLPSVDAIAIVRELLEDLLPNPFPAS
jgi:hypothetical protein